MAGLPSHTSSSRALPWDCNPPCRPPDFPGIKQGCFPRIKHQYQKRDGITAIGLLEMPELLVLGFAMHRIMYRITLGIFALSALLFAGQTPLAAQEGRTVLVLDASGSMWAKLGDRHRIEIARDVFAKLMEDLPEDQELGVVSYGHRRKSDCRDIQEIADFGTARDTMIKRVRKLNPRGKTPLSGSLEFAASKLNYKAERATVILVSDGRETCRRDPCVVAEQLAAEGFDFTAHVVGFDIDDAKAEAQLQCIADRTGGQYFAATNQEELSAALTGTFLVPAGMDPDTPAQLTLRASELANGPIVSAGLNWRILSTRSGAEIVNLSDTGPVALSLAPGIYDVEVTRTSDGTKGTLKRLRLPPGSERIEIVPLEIDFSASVKSLDGVELAVNSDITLEWNGPERKGDYLALAKLGSPDDAFVTRKHVTGKGQAKLRVPLEPGNYELRYVLGNPPKVLAQQPVTALDVIALVQAPDAVPGRKNLSVDWRGPGYAEDLLTIVPAGAEDTETGTVSFLTKGQAAMISVPEKSGLYELRYLLAGQRVLARKALEVRAPEKVIARLVAPETALAGARFELNWEGPNGKGEKIELIDRDGTSFATVDLANSGPAFVQAPLRPGLFTLLYSDENGARLVSAPLEIKDVDVAIKAPAEVWASRPFIARVSGPFFQGDMLMIADPKNPGAVTDRLALFESDERLQLLAPLSPGQYELRYLLRGKRVIASQILAVLEKG